MPAVAAGEGGESRDLSHKRVVRLSLWLTMHNLRSGRESRGALLGCKRRTEECEGTIRHREGTSKTCPHADSVSTTASRSFSVSPSPFWAAAAAAFSASRAFSSGVLRCSGLGVYFLTFFFVSGLTSGG